MTEKRRDDMGGVLGYRAERVKELQPSYDETVTQLRDAFIDTDAHTGLDDLTPAQELEVASFQKFNLDPSKPTIIMLAGMRATGKSIITEEVVDAEYPLVLNVTTRDQRPGEVEGVDYYFTDETTFKEMRERDEFVQWNLKPGRNKYYGTAKAEIGYRIDQSGGKGCLIVEDPDNFAKMLPNFGDTFNKVIIYTLPPDPGIEVLDRRLEKRQHDNGLEVTQQDFDSSINEQQITHAATMLQFANNPDVQTVWIVSEDPESTHEKVQMLFGEKASDFATTIKDQGEDGEGGVLPESVPEVVLDTAA